MPIDKNKLRRYQIYDDFFSRRNACFSRERIYQELNEILVKEGFPAKKIDGHRKYVVSQSTVNHDIAPENGNFMRDLCPKSDIETYIAPDGTQCYRYAEEGYSYWQHDLNTDELVQLKSILLLLQQFDNIPQYKTVQTVISQLENKYGIHIGDTTGAIGFESNENLEASRFLGDIFSAIVGKCVLRIHYQAYNKPEQEYLVHPYYLKQYNRGWFLFGLLEGSKDGFIINLALDRMKMVEPTALEYIETEIDFSNDYFYDLMGVTSPVDMETETVVLEFAEQRINYVLNKPIHGTQHVLDKSKGRIAITVKPAKELYQLLLSFGPDVEVISPDSVRAEMSKLTELMDRKYR